jgi:hypothetical protein
VENVSMRDYEGFGGFGISSRQDVEELNKALTAGSQMPRMNGGGALQVESLEQTLRILTYTHKHIRFWKDIPKLPAFSTVEEYTTQSTYGGDTGMFTNEGELPQVQDANYERKTALVKFLGTQREVSHVMTLVKPAHGNVLALETQNGANWLLERLERALFSARSDSVPQAFDGIDKQITDDALAEANNVFDLRGGILTQDAVEEATNTVVENYGLPTDIYAAPRCISEFVKQYYPAQQFHYPFPTDGKVGMSVKEIETQAGSVKLKGNIFLRSAKNNGSRKAPSAATAVRAPTAPTAGNFGAIAAGVATSKFGAADIGVYQYKVSAINRFGESAGSQETSGVTTTAALDVIDLTITDGGGADPATGYRIYRSRVGGAAGSEELIAEIPRIGAAATTVWRDSNFYLPGTSKGYMVQMDLQNLAFKQLAPMLKIPLATLAASIRWMQLLYGTPIVYSPRKNIIFRNLKDQ